MHHQVSAVAAFSTIRNLLITPFSSNKTFYSSISQSFSRSSFRDLLLWHIMPACLSLWNRSWKQDRIDKTPCMYKPIMLTAYGCRGVCWEILRLQSSTCKQCSSCHSVKRSCSLPWYDTLTRNFTLQTEFIKNVHLSITYVSSSIFAYTCAQRILNSWEA